MPMRKAFESRDAIESVRASGYRVANKSSRLPITEALLKKYYFKKKYSLTEFEGGVTY
jgi:hypothetical protein